MIALDDERPGVVIDGAPVGVAGGKVDVRRTWLAELSRWRHKLYAVPGIDDGEHYGDAEGRELATIDDADVISSELADPSPLGLDWHTIVLDVDVPARLVPSSTPGHSHLFIDVRVGWPRLRGLLHALADAGVIERGYADASIERGHTAVRLPWKRKARRND